MAMEVDQSGRASLCIAPCQVAPNLAAVDKVSVASSEYHDCLPAQPLRPWMSLLRAWHASLIRFRPKRCSPGLKRRAQTATRLRRSASQSCLIQYCGLARTPSPGCCFCAVVGVAAMLLVRAYVDDKMRARERCCSSTASAPRVGFDICVAKR